MNVEFTSGMHVLINLNDEVDLGNDMYSVEPAHDIGNWIESFETEAEALDFISINGGIYDPKHDFRDTRDKKG